MARTFIGATSLLQNRSTTHAPEVRERDEPWVPAGKGRTAFVDTRDVAAPVHSVRSHEGTACILTDPAALTDDVRRLTGRMPGTSGTSPAITHRLAAGHRGRSLSGWPYRRGPSARKRPAAALFSELPAREQGQKLPSSRAIRPCRRPGPPQTMSLELAEEEWP